MAKIMHTSPKCAGCGKAYGGFGTKCLTCKIKEADE